MTYHEIESLLGQEAASLLAYQNKTILRDQLHLPGPGFIDKTWLSSSRRPQVLKSLTPIFRHGRLANTGYLSILPVDRGIEHGAGSSFATNPLYSDPEPILQLAIQGGWNAVTLPLGALSIVARKYAHKIPCIVKINHNELLTYPNRYDQTMFGSVEEAWNLGATAIGATIYFGSQQAKQQLVEVSQAFERAHELGLATILWCYARNRAFKTTQADYHLAADITGQANHMGVTIQADIIKQKLPKVNQAS